MCVSWEASSLSLAEDMHDDVKAVWAGHHDEGRIEKINWIQPDEELPGLFHWWLCSLKHTMVAATNTILNFSCLIQLKLISFHM